jgi:glycine/sarcosine N-methyltransferase
MSFYSVLSRYYDFIFPFNEKEASFVFSIISSPVSRSLDIGCGIGNTASILSKVSSTVIGIDGNQDMVLQAQKTHPSLTFLAKDMRLLNELILKPMDVVTCFGNTLVHISNQEVQYVLKQWNTLLKDEGRLMIQIINYDRIMQDQITSLPTIDHELVSMERLYHHYQEVIEFETILTDKQKNQVFTQRVTLYPLLKADLESYLHAAGFESCDFYGGFDGQLWTPSSYATIVVAKKKAL